MGRLFMLYWIPRVRLWLSAALVISLLGCSVAPDLAALQEADFQVTQGIRDGYTDHTNTAVFGLVSIDRQTMGSCTGTLISPNTILTARHCVAPTLDQVNGGVDCSRTNFGATYMAQGLYVTNHTRFTRNPDNYFAVAEVLVPKAADEFCGNDVALITLMEPIDPSVAVPRIPRVDTKLVSGEKYYAVGYGATDDGGNGSGLRRRRDSLAIECVGDECPSYYVEPSEWIGDTGICQGDSGGPAFDVFDRVIGIASRGSYGCDSPVYGDVSSWGEWIKESTLNAARSAGVTPPPWTLNWPTSPAYYYPVGGECSMAAQCDSNICIEGYCSRVCNANSPCPMGYSCQGQCVAIPEPEPDKGGCNATGAASSAMLWLLPLLLFKRRRQN